MKVAVIIPVVIPVYAGKGAARPFSKVDGREVFLRTVEVYAPRNEVAQRIVVVGPDDLEEMRDRWSAHLGFQGVTVTAGGSDWFSCVARGLERLQENIDTILVHDACCPAVPYTMLNVLEEALEKHSGAAGVVATLPTRSAFADARGSTLGDHVDMAQVVEVQSPQIFRRAALVEAYAKKGTTTAMDDAELVGLTGAGKIVTVPGSRFNIRIDSEEMVRLAKEMVEQMPRPRAKMPLNTFGEAEW